MKRFLVRSGWVLVATVLCVAAAELWASTQVELPSAQLARDLRLHHTHQPLYEGPTLEESVDYEVRFNAKGWRENYEVALAAEPGTYRIFYVGDSFTKGVCPEPFCVPTLVEEALNADFASPGLRYEVVNAGTSSHSPILYYLLVRHYLLEYSPDLIVVSVDMTDVADDWRYRQVMVVDDQDRPWAVPPTKVYWRDYVTSPEGVVRADLATKVRFFLSNESHLYRYLDRRLDKPDKAAIQERRRALLDQSNRRAADQVRFGWCGYDWDADLERDVAYSMGILELLIELCRDNGIRVLVTGVPHFEQLQGDVERPEWSTRPHREIEALARASGVAYFDSVGPLVPDLQDRPHDEYYNQGDYHLNAAGNELWAALHIAALSDPANELLPAAAYR
jgi:hypothetical protein